MVEETRAEERAAAAAAARQALEKPRGPTASDKGTEKTALEKVKAEMSAARVGALTVPDGSAVPEHGLRNLEALLQQVATEAATTSSVGLLAQVLGQTLGMGVGASGSIGTPPPPPQPTEAEAFSDTAVPTRLIPSEELSQKPEVLIFPKC